MSLKQFIQPGKFGQASQGSERRKSAVAPLKTMTSASLEKGRFQSLALEESILSTFTPKKDAINTESVPLKHPRNPFLEDHVIQHPQVKGSSVFLEGKNPKDRVVIRNNSELQYQLNQDRKNTLKRVVHTDVQIPGFTQAKNGLRLQKSNPLSLRANLSTLTRKQNIHGQVTEKELFNSKKPVSASTDKTSKFVATRDMLDRPVRAFPLDEKIERRKKQQLEWQAKQKKMREEKDAMMLASIKKRKE